MTREDFYDYAVKKQRSLYAKHKAEQKRCRSLPAGQRRMLNIFHPPSYLAGLMDAYDKLVAGKS